MGDFAKAVSVLRAQGIGVTVVNHPDGSQEARIEGKGMEGGLSNKTQSELFTRFDMEVIRKLLSAVACRYKREDFYHHCCDANEIIGKIDRRLKSETDKED